jgi:acetylornithine deacetylase/succinyl-diaminopimelate desuccinylase-like protein
MERLEEVHGEIERRFPKHLEETRRFLRQPSVSATGEGIKECAQMVGEMMEEIGSKVKFWTSGEGHPVVYGELDVGAPRTLIEYEMYDVQPVGDLREWLVPPFSGTVMKLPDLPELGDCVVSRGVYNSKGALAGHMMTWRTIRDVDELPVNLKIIAEGEEEISSNNFIKFVTKHKEELRADGAFGSDYGQDLRGVPTVTLGAKGCVYLRITARGNVDTGGPMEREVHSSQAVWVASPVWRLVKALSTLVDDSQEPAIDGLMDDVAPPRPWEREMVRRLAATFEEATALREIGAAKFKRDLHGEDLLSWYLFRPLVNIDGIHAGFTDDAGTKTTLPHYAFAYVDIRLVPNMTVELTLQRVRDHLARRGFGDLEIESRGPYGWAQVSPDAWVVDPLLRTYEYHGLKPEVWPRSGGTVPFFVFDQVLGIPWVFGGLGHGGRAHAPNEYATVEGMRLYEKGEATFLYACADGTGVRGRNAR